ncbi:DUF4097 family beta strand repeat-containing protein [Nocardia camponoti]|uniref:DUF4097 domain-containing protein n=1 Tax=Nocardia camponoti TaxID=1616106 RepID=A0A917V834_9NOCA|nr:DUF4097 family beta strand repeat-containing protein [Nocardia camponoti]GGK49185.1 hypothetical protein GCM10011591_20700 [Nocardia camponoti]
MFTTPAAQPVAVAVDVLSAEVTVVASHRDTATVQINPADPSKKGDAKAAEQTTVDFTAGTLTVTTPKSWRTHTPFGGNPSIEVIIEVPSGSSLTADAGVGKFVAHGELGDAQLTIALGDIIIDRPLGSVTAKTAKGDIRVNEASRGELRLETNVGEIEVGVNPGSTVRVDANAVVGTVTNELTPVVSLQGDVVTVNARNSYGNIVIRHTAKI